MANGFKEVIQAVGAFKEEQVGSKRFSEWLKQAKEAVKTCTTINDKLKSYVIDAQDADRERIGLLMAGITD